MALEETIIYISKAQAMQKNDNLAIIKIKDFCASKDTIEKLKRQPQIGRKVLQVIYSIRCLYLEYIMNFYNSIGKRQSK